MKFVSRVYAWVLFAPALLPLFYIEGMMYPLMVPKTLALRALGIVALALFTWLVARGEPFFWSRLRRWEAWIPAVLLAVAYFASLFGVDFYRSFWSTFERGDGLLTLTVCVGYFYLILLSADTVWLSRLLRLVAWVGSFAALYAVLQWLAGQSGVDLPLFAKTSGRLGGTMGNAAFLAAYLGMTFFATLAAVREAVSAKARRFLYAGAGLQLFAILITATRGTLLALIAVGFAALVWRAFRKEESWVRKQTRVLLVVLVIIAGLSILFRGPLSRVPFEPIKRLASISFSDSTVASRLFLWEHLPREMLSRPLLGYGAEHIAVPFDKVYDPSVLIEEWFDRSHNAYLDYFIQFGIGGALLYLLIIAILGRLSYRLWQAGDRYGPFLFSLVAVYALQNFFVFDTAVTLWLLFALIAAALVYTSPDSSLKSVAIMSPHPIAGVIAGLLVLVLVVPAALQPLRANLLAFEAYLYQIVDVPRANAAADKALSLGTYADLELGYNAYFMYTEEQIKRLSVEPLHEAYAETVELLSNNFERYSYDVRTAVYLAQVLAKAPAGASANPDLLSEALTHSIDSSPKRIQPWYILANLSISKANTHPAGSGARTAGYTAAIDILSKYIELVPGLAMPHFVLAQLAYANGDTALAEREAEAGKARYKGGLETARWATIYYESVMDLQNAAFFLREILRFNPADANAREDLSQIEAGGF